LARAPLRSSFASRYVTVPFVGHVAARNDLSGCAAGIAATFLGAGLSTPRVWRA
jgi:hypothetical protein